MLTSRKSDPSSDSSPYKKPPSKPSGSDWIDNNASSRGDSVGVSKPSKFSFKSKSTTTSSVTEIVVDSSSNSSLKESLGERDTESTSSNWRSQGFSFGSSSKHEGEKPSTTKTLGYNHRYAQFHPSKAKARFIECIRHPCNVHYIEIVRDFSHTWSDHSQ